MNAIGWPIRIGSRPSKLALRQTDMVADALSRRHRLERTRFQIVPISTKGDRITDRPLADIGGKELFIKELEQALISEEIDIAVHSAKDLPAIMPDGLCLAATLPRATAHDVVLTGPAISSLDGLPRGARVGTGSPRRKAMLLYRRGDLAVEPLRGNVDTRIAKLDNGDLDAIILAAAGLERMGLAHRASFHLPLDQFVPAGGQGCIAVQTRQSAKQILALVSAINDPASAQCLRAERRFLGGIGADCHSPVGVHARADSRGAHFHAMILSPEGAQCRETRLDGSLASLEEIGEMAADELMPHARALF